MEIPLHNKNGDDYATIFSKIEDDTQKIQKYEQMQNDLSMLQQNISLLNFYGSKGKFKLNQKKIKKKLYSLPKVLQTEPDFRTKKPKKIIKKKEFDLFHIKNNNINSKKTKHEHINDTSKTQFTTTTKPNFFVTKTNYKSENKNVHKIATRTNYNININNTFNKSKNSNALPNLRKINYKASSSTDNSFIKPKNKIIDINSRNKTIKHVKRNTLSYDQFPTMTNNMIRNMKKENNNIKKKINKGMEKFNIMEWYMKTRFKYAEYKYGIAEIQKYFMDIKSYGKPEEEEIEKRKTFLEHVEDIIEDIHQVQKKKEIEKLNKKYGVEHDKRKILNSKNEMIDLGSPKKKQMVELSKALQEISKRKKKEKKRREQINDILFKCDQGVHSINILDRKLPKGNNII